MEYREAKLIFAWSQMLVTDELKSRKRQTSLTLFDLIEALARLAELISPPEPQAVDDWLAACAPPAQAATSFPGSSAGSVSGLTSRPGTAGALTAKVSVAGKAPPAGSRSGSTINSALSSGTSKVSLSGLMPQPAIEDSPSARLSAFWERVGAEGPRLRRATAELLAQPTRPLSVKFGALMDVLVLRHRAMYGGGDEAALVAKLRMRSTSMCAGASLP